ncbi:hypothetical protein QBC39DRAFT_301394 [Podospora conica]|nr:hypothetical protein QBC39DRAFT_301394 [Schizothecium conicum]
MASFFQPLGSSGDPVIIACNTTGNTRQVYCNRILSSEERWQTPLQKCMLAASVACLATPLIVGICLWLYRRRKTGRVSAAPKAPGAGWRRRPTAALTRQSVSVSPRTLDLDPLASIQGFHFLARGAKELPSLESPKVRTAWIVPLLSPTEPDFSHPPIPTCRTEQNVYLGVVDGRVLSMESLPKWTNFLSTLVLRDKIVSAVFVRVDTLLDDREELPELVTQLITELGQREVPVVLNCGHDDVDAFKELDLDFISGVIVDNACILRDGSRRDYFGSQPLRDIMTRCAQARAGRPGFFVGFHDGWEQRPSAAVVCRAVKVARHFQAVFKHGPVGDDGWTTEDLPPSLSGFEFLRKPEISELQQSWTKQKRKVHIGPGRAIDSEEVACLDLDLLGSVLPQAGTLFRSVPVTATADEDASPSSSTNPPPNYVALAPPRVDFWESSPDGEQLSSQGCFPLTVFPSPAHHDAVAATQTHLRTLDLLHRLEPIEVDKIVEQLKRLQSTAKHFHLVRLLIDGLSHQIVLVHRGLGTGFNVPDTPIEFWGVAAINETAELAIHLSRRSPNDTATVLHVWLAHHGVSRIQRYEEELRLERATRSDPSSFPSLPISIQRSITDSTPSEALFLLEQLQVSHMRRPFKRAIEEHCRLVLIEETSTEAWNDAHSRGILDGSSTVPGLLQRRLNHFRSLGLTALPTLQNLTQLSVATEQLVRDALFSGEAKALVTMSDALLHAYDPLAAWNDCEFVDVNTDLFALIFFCALRQAALDDVYLEATDHCPIFSQPDQAAVFSELWVLGSQCELFFGTSPRTLGRILYDRHRAFLQQHPPPIHLSNRQSGLMTVYAKLEPAVAETDTADGSMTQKIAKAKEAVSEFGAITIFCLPAMLDIVLLTFVGRGLFMTAFMGDTYLTAACYALLISLLLSAATTGWVGSVGNYYLVHYAYGSMIYFHVQRLSGGFVLSFVAGTVGAVIFGVKVSVNTGLTFLAYLCLVSTYLNILGVLATMHQRGSPLTSGRSILWRTMPVLFLSPLLSSFVNDYDLVIYLSVGYLFLSLLLFQYRRLCREWMNWMDNIPQFTEKDILDWHTSRTEKRHIPDDTSEISVMINEPEYHDDPKALALASFRDSLRRQQARLHKPRIASGGDSLVVRVERGLPYIEWLLKKGSTSDDGAELFSGSWFARVSQAVKVQQQMTQGLKEHSNFMLFRHARYDIGQNIGLFLICLMDRWVSIAMAANSPPINMFSHFTSRYAICLAILYFCGSVMVLDITLHDCWKVGYMLSEKKLSSLTDAVAVTQDWERRRQRIYLRALQKLGAQMVVIFGGSSFLVWASVSDPTVIKGYLFYAFAYTGIIIFQFNRCFTTNIRAHVCSVFASAATGFITGCVLHVARGNRKAFFFTDIVALAVASISSALLTSIWAWNDSNVQGSGTSKPTPSNTKVDGRQPEITAKVAWRDIPGSDSTVRRENQELMHDLCLGADVDTEWGKMCLSTRQQILARLTGDRTATSLSLGSLSSLKAVDPVSRLLDTLPSLPEHDHCPGSTGSEAHAIYEPGSVKEQISTPRPRQPMDELCERNDNTTWGKLALLLSSLPRFVTQLVKWAGLITGAGANVEREIWHIFRHHHRLGRAAALTTLLPWRVCRKIRNCWTWVILIYHHSALVSISALARNGVSRTLQRNRLVWQLRRKTVTGFAFRSEESSLALDLFEDDHVALPENRTPIASIFYDEIFRVSVRHNKEGGRQSTNTYKYATNSNSRVPICKEVVDAQDRKICYYDGNGRVMSGTIKLGGIDYRFLYFYKTTPRDSNEILKAEFRLAGTSSTDSLTVYWGALTIEDSIEKLNWIPSNQVCRVVRKIKHQTYLTVVNYSHRRDPVWKTVLKGKIGDMIVARPTCVFEHDDLLQQRPTDNIFEDDDPLIHHRRHHIALIARFSGRPLPWTSFLTPSAWQYLRKKTASRRVPTWWLRTELWNHWRKGGTLDAITACWMDELILREEPLLRGYWNARSSGRLAEAKAILDSHVEQIAAAIEMDKEVSEVCMLPIKPSDLYAMGLSREANQVTLRPQDCFSDTEDRISVVFNDIGCWPDAPGGVSNCRRDLVDGHSTIRNHVLAESANEYGIPRFQVERNVQSLKMLPLWGLDGRTANHGLIDNLLESQVDTKILNTKVQRDIVEVFVPLLKLFVKGARSRSISSQGMVEYSDAILALFQYFEDRDYNKTWTSKEVATGWVEAWLTPYDSPNIIDVTDSLELEKPSLTDFRTALEIYSSCFFIFSVQTPEECPKVFQSTHHGISSLFGAFLKRRRGTTFGIWDHAILWRECCLNLSPAQSTLSVPVQSMVLAGIGLAARLAYFHADVILPCTPVFNPIWEVDIGTDSGRLCHKNRFRRKIDAIVNGVSNMNAFQPVDKIGASKPTVVMLSNVQFIKDIKTAILAADVIVNKFGFPDYQLLIYGARDREPAYDIEMTRLIESCRLTDRVILKGFGKPHEALQDAWLFMNSSLSEGLPLAIAEAALAGVPIVATAVGATALVLTDPDDPSVRYGEVVPPNDPTALARAQIAVLAMAGPWAKFAGDVDRRGSVLPHLLMPDSLTQRDVKWLTERMYAKTEDRRKLGLLGREMVLRGFHGKRYLREHEQMYWVQWHLAKMRLQFGKPKEGADSSGVSGRVDEDETEGIVTRGNVGNGGGGGLGRKASVRWQEFASYRKRYQGKRLKKTRRAGEGSSGHGEASASV